MGAPKDLSTPQRAKLVELTRDQPETNRLVQSRPDGTIEITLPMSSNDIVLVRLVPRNSGE